MQEFGLEFPVWTIGATFPITNGNEGFSIVRINDAECGPCLPLFTDEDLADRFINLAKTERTGEYHTIVIEDPKSLAKVANCLAEKGCEYAVVDCFLRENGPPSVYIPVEKILDACEQMDS